MLLTDERIAAAANINRFNGWTRRPYSILEHMVIGAMTMRHLDYHPMAIRAFLIHDMHETEIVGDVPTPDKALYMAPEYFEECARLDLHLCDSVGVDPMFLMSSEVKEIDAAMLAVESDLLFTGDWRAFHSNDAAMEFAGRMITSEVCRGLRAIDYFDDMLFMTRRDAA